MSKGKNFSMNNVGQRKKSDFYETHYSLTWQLMDTNLFEKEKRILEPSCGDGAIIKALNQKGYNNVLGTDLSLGSDFLQFDSNVKYDYIITNPPFSLALEFILKAKEIAKEKIAMLLPLNYLHGEERYNRLYKDIDFPLQYVYTFTRYPMLGEALREDGKYPTGMMTYSWYIFDKSYIGEPKIRWISNQQYVLSKKDRKE